MTKIVIRLFFLLFMVHTSTLSQVGGGSVFQFLSLNNSPRVSALGGYAHSIITDDLNIGLYNPAVINSQMNKKVAFNYTNYYDGIYYGNTAYAFKLDDLDFISAINFINYGDFVETNYLGEELGYFSAGEYLFTIGTSYSIHSNISLGLNTKWAYSSFYDVSSFALLCDFATTYIYPQKDIIISLLMKNLGYQLIPYYEGNRESLPFELLLGFSNKLEHMPLRWHLTFQHIEKKDLTFPNSNVLLSSQDIGVGEKILRHVVLGAEFLISENINILLGYNNRIRSEMILQDRRGMVGFSFGFMIKVKRFQLTYSRSSNYYLNPTSTFGIVTNLSKLNTF